MLTLDKLTRTEKLQLMEALWDDLSADADALPSPAWHRQALDAAQEALACGQAQFIDWTQAKHTLRGE
ncbi:MAG: addiction module protein [Acidovorax sp.]|uniref:addiction module protein n=1 Tax=Acidovorax sp. TaxID=1872122 RepID=UPI0039E2FD1F